MAEILKKKIVQSTECQETWSKGIVDSCLTAFKDIFSNEVARVVAKLFEELGPRYKERPGGYIRILKCGFRTGDAAPMAYVELVDRPVVEEVEDDEE